MPLSPHEMETIRRRHGDPRPLDRIRFHYEIERRLADRLKQSEKQARKGLYTALYEDLFRQVDDHPQLQKRSAHDAADIAMQLDCLRPFLEPDHVFIEVGAGDCRLSFAAAALVRQAIAVDITEFVKGDAAAPANFEFRQSDGTSIPAAENSIDVVYSNQLMEHLHPEDAHEQLANIHRALKPGGIYYCITPNRLTGPHDISLYFDRQATGLHLKEYGYSDLTALFKAAGFRKCAVAITARGRHVMMLPPFIAIALEGLLKLLPRRLRLSLCGLKPIRIWVGVRLIGIK